MIKRGICSMSLTVFQCTLNDVISFIGKTSMYDNIDESNKDSTSRTEHICHMLCLINPGDRARIRTQINRNIRHYQQNYQQNANHGSMHSKIMKNKKLLTKLMFLRGIIWIVYS